MKILIIVGSARKKYSWLAARLFREELKKQLEAEIEILRLSDYNIDFCLGCKNCIDKGEEFCPLEDDSSLLIEKMRQSDGLLFVSPNYSFHVSGLMKAFIDKFGYLFHRPQFFGKVFTSITVQGIYGGKKIAAYFDFMANAMGFLPCKVIVINSLEPMTEKQQLKNQKGVIKLSQEFARKMQNPKVKHPNLFELMIFRISRSKIKNMLNEDFRDYTYFQEQGWFESDFYYPVKLNPLKKLFGRLIDILNQKSKII